MITVDRKETSMKRLFIIAASAAIFSAALVSCNKDLGPSISDMAAVEPMSVGVYNGMLTKAPVTGTVMPTSRSIVFSAYHNAQEGTSANFFTGITFTKKEGENTLWQCSKYWPLTGTLDLLGYCLDDNSRVSSVSWGSNNAASVTMTLADNSTNQDDLLVGGASTLTSESNAVVFKHAQALLTFTARSSVAYDATANYGITITGIQVNGSYHSGTVACTRDGGNITFVWSSLGSQADISLPTMTATNLGTAPAAIEGTQGLILPAQAQTDITIYYTLHNGKDASESNIDNTLQYTFHPVAESTWDAGKKYIYNINVTLTGIEVSASVADWAAQSGTAVPIPSAE